MRTRISRLLAALAFALSFLCAPAGAVERVLAFHGDVRIGADGRLSVTETIEVQVEGKEIRRGILRDFPIEYRDRRGARVSVPFEVEKVMRNGAAEPFSVEKRANGARIRIGDAGRMLPYGKHVYTVTYRTGRQVGFFERHDELYWNVNGNGWSFAFEQLSAEVTLPRPVPAGELRVEAYTGVQGARGRDYNAFVRDGRAAFRATRALKPAEGMTIVVAFPKGVVAPPTHAERASAFLGANQGVAAGIGGLILLLVFLTWRWVLVGRDPLAGPRFPRYVPPPSLGPAGVRFVDRMGFDERCFAAALLGLGSRGYLRIRQLGERWRIERTGRAVYWYAGEEPMVRRLLAEPHIEIGKAHDPAVEEARRALALELQASFGGRLFSKNQGSLYAAVALVLASGVLMFALEAPPFFAGVLIFAMLFALLAFSFWLPAYSVSGRKVQDAIEGLRQYLSIAEKDDLSRMQAPPQTAEEFARFLPYAVALGVEKTWAERFASVLGAAAVGSALSSYYSGDGALDAESFSRSLGELGSTIAAAATPPGSDSGSDGGGSSGGGGGGGGGSGW